MTRAKFKVTRRIEHEGGNIQVFASPVMGDSPENKIFWQYTPTGSLELSVTNSSLDQFKAGTEFYMDLTPIEKSKE